MSETNNTTEQQKTRKPLAKLYTGRRVIYTDESEVNSDNIQKVLYETMPDHEANRTEMSELFKYESGNQPIFYRVKDIRPEINIPACANYAREIVDFKLGYEFASPFTLVQRAKDDFRKADPKQDDKRISSLNEMFFEQDKPGKDLRLARNFKICGLAYMMAYPKKNNTGEVAPFDLLVLNPMNTYIVRTNDAYQRKVLAVTYTILKNGTKRITAYTNEWVFEGTMFGVEPEGESVNGFKKTANQIGMIPIVEFENNHSRQGAFEPVIPLMDALNIVNSDRVNDVAQYVQSILWLHNCKIDEDQKQELRDGGFIQTKTTADGREAKVTYVTSPLEQSQTQTLVDYMYGQILEIAGVPGRDTATGGNTGSAILLSNGWQIAETQAKASEMAFTIPSKELLQVVLAIIQNTPNMPDELKTVSLSDVLFKSSRNRTYDLVSRTAAMNNMINIGIIPEKAIEVVDIFDDSHQVAMDSLERIDKILFSQKNSTQQEDKEPDMGDGNSVDGVKGTEDVKLEQSREGGENLAK